jgi:hypothetical protein
MQNFNVFLHEKPIGRNSFLRQMSLKELSCFPKYLNMEQGKTSTEDLKTVVNWAMFHFILLSPQRFDVFLLTFLSPGLVRGLALPNFSSWLLSMGCLLQTTKLAPDSPPFGLWYVQRLANNGQVQPVAMFLKRFIRTQPHIHGCFHTKDRDE